MREFTFKTIFLVIYIIGSFPIRGKLVPYTSALECGFTEMPLGLVWLWVKLNQSDQALFLLKNVDIFAFLVALTNQAALFFIFLNNFFQL